MSATAGADQAPLVVVRNLVKRYGALAAVRDVSFEIRVGECLGLLGPNGAGKSTTMRMLLGLARPSAGSLALFGVPFAEIGREQRHRIGLVPQDNNLDPDLSVRQNLEVYARYFGQRPSAAAARIDELLVFMQLESKAEAQVMELSGGMRRRLVIARALIAEPTLFILDEPTTGLDPQARVLIWQQLALLKRRGTTILLTTHYMDEAQRLCDRIILIDQGAVLDEGTPTELIARHAGNHVFELAKPLPSDLALGDAMLEDAGEHVIAYVRDAASFTRLLPAEVSHLQRPANLEDVFLRLTGRQLRED